MINELLAYIQNKLSICDEESLVRICKSSFTSDEIKNAKTLLYDSIPTNKLKVRKNKGKEERDLYDILNLFKTTEEDVIPLFVARQLEKLPPILFDHLDCTKLLKDLLKLQNDLEMIKTNYVTQEQLSECKIEITQLKNNNLSSTTVHRDVNIRRGAWLCDSGPVGLSYTNNSSINDSSDNIEVYSEALDRTPSAKHNNVRVNRKLIRSNQRSPPLEKVCGSDNENAAATECVGQVEMTSPLPAVSSADNDNVVSKTDASVSKRPCVISAHGPVELQNKIENGGWQTVKKRKKNPYRYYGTSGIAKDKEGNFKAAEQKVPIFITKVHKDTMNKDIEDYVYRKTNETITLETISFKQERDYKAFKFFVLKSKLSTFLDDKLWPEGIVFRRFINFRPRKANGNSAVPASRFNVI